MIRILLSTRLGERRWTQADLARKTGIRASTINDLYHELAERVSLEHLDLICEALECDLSDLIIREPNSIPANIIRKEARQEQSGG
ncbi:MAG: helix-turn-helix transcriptional regulator [Oscillospiraceae bacterium]|nr:helix-turn-helix transcriptional regulator [Oscillospiraceae bacterium]